jgi:hypothetical protein
MKKKLNILTMLVLVAALAGVGILVKRAADMRSGATFASVDALFLPSTQTVKVGDKLVTTMMIDAKTYLLTGADLRIKYDQSKLSLDSADVLTKDNSSGSNVWLQSADEVVLSNFNSSAGTFSLVGTDMQKDPSSLPTAVISIVKLNFTAIAAGTASVGLDSSYANTIAGYNPAGSSQELGIDKVEAATYTISSVGIAPSPAVTGEPQAPCNLTVNPPRSCSAGFQCMTASKMAGADGICVKVAVVTTPTTVNCGWCGTSCLDLNKRSNMACPMIAVTGEQCVNVGGSCAIKATVVITRPLTPINVPPTGVSAGNSKITPGSSVN